MKNILLVIGLLLINFFCTGLIGMAGIQEKLTVLVYFLPIILDIVITSVVCRKNKKRYIVLLALLILFFVVAIVLSLIIYINGNTLSSIIALCTFIFIFNILPLSLSSLLMFINKTE